MHILKEITNRLSIQAGLEEGAIPLTIVANENNADMLKYFLRAARLSKLEVAIERENQTIKLGAVNMNSKVELDIIVKDGLASKLFQLDYADFIKTIQASIPEAAFLHGTANVSAEGAAAAVKVEKKLHGIVMEDEEIRAFAGLLRLKDVICGDDASYRTFVECQIEMKKPVLTRASFDQLNQYVKEKLITSQDCAAAIWSILCNDLGKVHAVIAEYEKLPKSRTIGHDQLLAELLINKPELFPAFSALAPEYRTHILTGYASGCDISQFEQLELPVISLQSLTTLNKKALDLYILHSIFDVSGAAAHFKSNGSLTMHEETWQFFDATRRALEKLHHQENNTIEEAYASYLNYRGSCIGIPKTTNTRCALEKLHHLEHNSIEEAYAYYLHYRGSFIGIPRSIRESVALIRIAGLARLATPTQGEMLSVVFEQLPSDTKETLVRELNIHGGKGIRAIFVGYGVAMLLNPQGALQRELSAFKEMITAENRTAATMEGLRIGLIHLGNAFSLARKNIGNSSTKEIFVAECDAIARALNKNPRELLHMDWKVTAMCERRMDFDLSPRLEPASAGEPVSSISIAALKAMADRSSSPLLYSASAAGGADSTPTINPKL